MSEPNDNHRTRQLYSLNDLQQQPVGHVHRWPVVATVIIVLVEAVVLGFAAQTSGSAVL